jgi:adenosylhomocysteine nucleosidase
MFYFNLNISDGNFMRYFTLLVFALAASACASIAPSRDLTSRIAVISAFEPELVALEAMVEDRRDTTINGVTFVTGRMAGKDIVLFLSGVSMVNAAMTTQMALDRFTIDRIVVSGVAGGVDPNLDVGDVVVASQWGQYLESLMARETAGGFDAANLPVPHAGLPNFGMMFVRNVQIARGASPPEQKLWFPADPAMLEIARTIIDDVALKRCAGDQCLAETPDVVVGGNGVSGASFIDNAALREWAFKTFEARVLDMESAAIAHVAYVNQTPFIAFRSLSDLAGGEAGANQAQAFYRLASDNSAAVVAAFLRALPD